MKDVYDYARYFIKNGYDTNPNTFDANMKLQKLLVFADLINLAKYNKPLFNDEIMAFQNGCVVEKVRKRYKYDYHGFKEESERYNPDFTIEEYDTLSETAAIFGKLSARELSELNHGFEFWKDSFSNSEVYSGYYDQSASVVSLESIKKELPKIQVVLDSYNESKQSCMQQETINGITFFYEPGTIEIDDVTEQLYMFSTHAEDEAYTVFVEEGELVIY